MSVLSVEYTNSVPLHIGTLMELFRNDVVSVSNILEKFRKEISSSIEQIEAMIPAGRAEEARRILHTLKGTAGIVLADDLYNVVAHFEQAIRTGQTKQVPDCLQKLQAEITRCVNYIPEDRLFVEEHSATCSK